jgi:CO/xanthine dehydrogenase Mo-binding subunit
MFTKPLVEAPEGAPAGREELRIVNKSIPRHDAAEKIAGATRYAADFALDGMLHARLVRSQLPSARIVKRDVSEALCLPGVVAVLLGEDVPHNEVWVDVPGHTTELSTMKAQMQVLATERVRYHGEPIALIVAETEDILADAEAAVKIEYEELPGVFDPAEALCEGAPLVHGSGNLLAEWHIDDGDVDATFATADIIVDGEYTCQFVDHAYLETEAGVAWIEDNGVITIRASTQVIEHFRDVARILDVPESRVRVIAPYVGGGFGGKEDMTVEPYLALAAQRCRRPVRMTWSRQESLLARPKRHRLIMRYRTAACSDGTIVGHDIDLMADGGAYVYLSPLVLLYAAVTAGGPYRVPNMRLRARTVYTNHPPCSAFRGFGAMQVVFAYESQMDRLAHALGIHPAQIRKRNALAKGDTLPVGQRIDTEVMLAQSIDAVYEAATVMPQPSGPRKRVGRGIASNIQPYGRLVWLNDSASAWIGFELDGSLAIRIGVPDVGGGQASSLTQIASEILGVPVGRIAIYIGDSALTPLAGTTTATRQLYMSGNAVLVASRMLLEQILRGVAIATGAPLESLSAGDDCIAGLDKACSLREAIAMCLRVAQPIHAFGTFYGPKGKEVKHHLKSDRIFPDFTFGTHLTDVEVDIDTGAVEVLRYVACHDVGRAINPQSVEGQISGAVAQGIGYALMERVVFDRGINLSTGFFQYQMPTALDLPDITCVVLESGDGVGPFGARGIGEPPIGPCAAAIASAIENAIGVRPVDLPILPEKVVACLDSLQA